MDAPLSINADLQPKLAEWFASQSNMTWLQAVLNTPEGNLLVEVLRESALPTEQDLHGIADESYLSRVAITHAKQVGVRNCIESLVSLRHHVEVPEELSKEWETD